jgi:hypothetical protein
MIRRALTIAAVAAIAIVAGVRSAPAQELRGFAGAGVMSDVNSQHVPAFGGGALVDVGQPWISAGAQGEAFVSWPYFAGRGTVFGQGNLMRRGAVRPFLLAGAGFGETAGPMFGGGVEMRPRDGRLGFRVAVEDYISDITPYVGEGFTAHQVTVRIAVVFK